MQLRGRRLKFTAVAALVVLSLTGFSTGRGHGSSGSSSGDGGGGGGGCSSSSQNHDSSSSTSGGSTYRDDDNDTGSSSGSSSGVTSKPLRDAKVELVTCATEDEAYATVEVTNPNSRGSDFTVTVRFLDAGSEQVDVRSKDEFVPAKGVVKVRVPLAAPGMAAQVDRCDPDLYAPAG